MVELYTHSTPANWKFKLDSIQCMAFIFCIGELEQSTLGSDLPRMGRIPVNTVERA